MSGMTTLREAALEALEALESYEHYIHPLTNYFGGPEVPREGSTSAQVEEAIRALRAALEQAEPVAWREAFETWAASYSTLSLVRDGDGYDSIEQTMLWDAWQAAKTNAPEGASGGESHANARLGLAITDSTCQHDYVLQPTSSIWVCLHCGRMQRNKPKKRPVAWMYDFPNPNNPREDVVRDWVAQDLTEVERNHGFNVRPLYADSPAAQCPYIRSASEGTHHCALAQRQPLTDEQIEDDWERITGHSIFGGDRSDGRTMYLSPDEVIEFARAIEAAHGIGGGA